MFVPHDAGQTVGYYSISPDMNFNKYGSEEDGQSDSESTTSEHRNEMQDTEHPDSTPSGSQFHSTTDVTIASSSEVPSKSSDDCPEGIESLEGDHTVENPKHMNNPTSDDWNPDATESWNKLHFA